MTEQQVSREHCGQAVRITPDNANGVSATSLAKALGDGVRSIELRGIYRHWSLMDQLGGTLAEALRRAHLSRSDVEISSDVGRIAAVEGAEALNDGAYIALIAVRFARPGLIGWDDIVRFDHVWVPEFLERQTLDLMFVAARD